jgi:hypothetical protein
MLTCHVPVGTSVQKLPNGYGHKYEFLPVGMIMCGDELRPQILSRAGICFTRPISDPLSSLIVNIERGDIGESS